MMQSNQIIASPLKILSKQVYPGLSWAGLGWPGLGWPGLAWTGLDWLGLAWAGLQNAHNGHNAQTNKLLELPNS